MALLKRRNANTADFLIFEITIPNMYYEQTHLRAVIMKESRPCTLQISCCVMNIKKEIIF